MRGIEFLTHLIRGQPLEMSHNRREALQIYIRATSNETVLNGPTLERKKQDDILQKKRLQEIDMTVCKVTVSKMIVCKKSSCKKQI